jgi:hypothetical protein
MGIKREQLSRDEFTERTQALIVTIASAKVEAGRLGLWRTMHSLEEPVTRVGYEVADVLEGKHPTKLKPEFWSNLPEAER